MVKISIWDWGVNVVVGNVWSILCAVGTWIIVAILLFK